MKKLLLATLFAATAAQAQVVAPAGNGVVVADAGSVTRHDAALRVLWRAGGPEQPSAIASSETAVAILDSYANEVRLLDLGDGQGRTFRTGETPVAAAFAGGELFVLTRDGHALERIGTRRASIPVALDPAFLRESGGMLYVYSRLEGIVQEIDPRSMRVTRRVQIAPFASDFEIGGTTGYLALPREGTIRTLSLKTFERGPSIAAGSVPTDLAIVGRASAVSATRLAVADPSAKRIWTIEGTQSVAGAVGRGFLRGLLGLGLFAPRNSEFPTGVDRVLSTTVAYDSSTKTLYAGKNRRPLTAVEPTAFARFGERVVALQNGTLRYAD